jgi:hypothetical protein
MNDQPKTKWRWRLLRWGLIGLAGLVTLAAILVTEENWRGKRAWENYKHVAEARGERFDLASVIPPAVPDDQNFFCAPIVTNALKNSTLFNIYCGDSENWPTNGGNWQKRKLTDLKQWKDYFRKFSQSPAGKTNGFPIAAQPQAPAVDVLLALSCFDPAFEDFRQASLRPHARAPLNYEEGFELVGAWLPCLASEKRWAQFLQLRVLADLQAGQSQAALEDAKLFLRVIDSLRDQPYLISHLVRIAMMAIALQPVYEGLAQHRWDDAQLSELEAALAKEDFLADYKTAMRGERMCGIDALERMRLTREEKSSEPEDHGRIVTNSLRLMPSAFFYQNELACARGMERWILPLADETNRIVFPAAVQRTSVAIANELKHYSPYKVLSVMSLPAVSRSVMKFAWDQGGCDLARVACALERFRLAHGNYPETLDALPPQFIEKLPHDIINGQPLHYRRTEDGKFVLYSVGWDEKDDGGKIVFTKSGSVDREKGDWVWRYPAQ